MNLGGIKITSGRAPTFDRTDWTNRQIRGSEKRAVISMWLGVIVPIGLVSLILWWTHVPFFFVKNIPNPIVCVLGVSSFIFLIRATWETIRLKRFGDPILELNTAPIRLGGALEGRINLTFAADNSPEFAVSLACIHRVQSGSGKNSHISESVLWSAETKTSLLLGGILPISIALPHDQPHTNAANPFDRILWRLTVKAPFRGQSFLEKYEVPVGQPAVVQTA